MPTQTDLEETPTPSSTGVEPDRDYVNSGLDQAEAFANDQANSAPTPTYRQNVGGNLNFIKTNRKKFVLGGGVLSLILIAILGFLALLPLKLESMIKNFEQAAGGRAESYVEKRTDVLVYRYLYAKITGNLASDAIYTNSNVVKMFWGNLQKNNFEAKLKDKGINLERTGPHSLKITRINGPTLGTINSPEELERFLDKSVQGREARSAIKLLTTETTRSWQFMKRRHLLKYATNAYNIKKLNFTKAEDKTDPQDPAKPSDTETQIREDALDSSSIEEGLDCITGGTCQEPDERHNPDGSAQGHPPRAVDTSEPDQPGADVEAKAGQGVDEAKSGVRDAYKQLKETAAAKTEGVLTTLFGDVVGKAIFKAVPVVGWIALAADLDKFLWEGRLRTIAINMHSAQYAAAFASAATFVDQMKAGELTASQVNVMGLMIASIEKSNAFQRVFMKEDAGLKVSDDKMVGNDTGSAVDPTKGKYGPCDIGYLPATLSGSVPSPGTNLSGSDFWVWQYRNAAAVSWHTPLCVVRPVLNKINGFLGDVIGTVLDWAGWILNKLTGGVSEALVSSGFAKAQEGIGWMFNHIFKPVYSGEWGAPLGNAIYGGAEVVYNQYTADTLGGKRIPYTDALKQQSAIDSETNQDLSRRGLIASLMDIGHSQSLGSQFLAAIPATPQGVADQAVDFAHTAFVNPMSFVFNFAGSLIPGAHAATTFTRNFAGIQTIGFTDDELNDPSFSLPTVDIAGPPVADGKLTGPDGVKDQYDCPQSTDLETSNRCLLDVATLQAACFGALASSGGDPTGCGAPSINAATPENGTTTSSDIVTLVESILANPDITYPLDNPGTNGKTQTVLTEVAGGGSFHTTCPDFAQRDTTINIKILQFLDEVGTKTKIGVNAITDKCHTADSKHYSGEAIDLQNGIGNLSIILDVAKKYGGTRNSETDHIHLDFPK